MKKLTRGQKIKKSKIEWIHPECALHGICQETDSFKGTVHEGVNVCEDGCVRASFKPKKK